jgi:2-keto-4-pentenoate hydratase
MPVGTVVTTGTWCGMLPAAAGDLVTARFDDVGQASVQL